MSTTPAYLLAALAHLQEPPPPNRPHVTLSYAQSVDAKIAGKDGEQILLSGKESMVMTHWMRTLHDGIMIGVGTATNDDPQLNARHLPQSLAQPYPLPQPIVLDPRLRLSPTCKLLKNYKAQTGRQPVILCRTPDADDCASWKRRHNILSQAGASIIHLDSSQDFLPLTDVLEKLSSLGIKSLMVEGGARIINSFLQASLDSPLIDVLIVTVAPTLIGPQGVSYASAHPTGIPHLRHSDTQVVGNDAVFILKPVKA